MVNRVILVGNLGKDPEVRYTSGGQAVANLRIATSRSWTDKQSGPEEGGDGVARRRGLGEAGRAVR